MSTSPTVDPAPAVAATATAPRPPGELSPAVRGLMGAAALSLGVNYFVPFWEIRLWAPQYPEGLRLNIWLDRISGDYEIINGINHYIGMRSIRAEMFPEFLVLPWLVGGLMAAGLLPALLGRRRWLVAFAGLLCAGGVLGLIDFYRWGYDYGHNLDPRAAINVPGMSYQPPLLGYKALLNFVAYSGPAAGGWVFIGVGALSVGLAVRGWWRARREGRGE